MENLITSPTKRFRMDIFDKVLISGITFIGGVLFAFEGWFIPNKFLLFYSLILFYASIYVWRNY